MTKKLLVFVFVFVIAISAMWVTYSSAASLAENLSGKILLQVEDNGEAWYIYPKELKRYYLGRPADAFEIMRTLGVGISNENLGKITVAESNFNGDDTDGDGLSDVIESAFGSNPNDPDSDNDGYNDKEEVLAGFDPTIYKGPKVTSSSFANQHLGTIFLQVEKNGEAWYVNPGDAKRYFLGRPADAFNIMRSLGLGISNDNLNKITATGTLPETETVATNEKDCGTAYPDKVDDFVDVEVTDIGTATTRKPDYSQDAAMTCFGVALLNDCQKAIIKVQNEEGTVHTEQILGKSNSEYCNLKVTYNDVLDTDTSELMYENSYLQCDFPQAAMKDQACTLISNDLCEKWKLKDSPAQVYAGTFAGMGLGALFSPDEIDCTGDMIEKIKNYTP